MRGAEELLKAHTQFGSSIGKSSMGKRYVVAALLLTVSVCSAEDFHPITHRRIAQTMSADGADWLVRPERESEEHPDEALDAIGIQRGSTVADIGAGVGYFTWRLAERVGGTGPA